MAWKCFTALVIFPSVTTQEPNRAEFVKDWGGAVLIRLQRTWLVVRKPKKSCFLSWKSRLWQIQCVNHDGFLLEIISTEQGHYSTSLKPHVSPPALAMGEQGQSCTLGWSFCSPRTQTATIIPQKRVWDSSLPQQPPLCPGLARPFSLAKSVLHISACPIPGSCR